MLIPAGAYMLKAASSEAAMTCGRTFQWAGQTLTAMAVQAAP